MVDILRKGFRLVRGVNVLGFQSHHYLSGYEIEWRGRTIIAYSSNWLSASHAILAGTTFPANTMAYDTLPHNWSYQGEVKLEKNLLV